MATTHFYAAGVLLNSQAKSLVKWLRDNKPNSPEAKMGFWSEAGQKIEDDESGRFESDIEGDFIQLFVVESNYPYDMRQLPDSCGHLYYFHQNFSSEDPEYWVGESGKYGDRYSSETKGFGETYNGTGWLMSKLDDENKFEMKFLNWAIDEGGQWFGYPYFKYLSDDEIESGNLFCTFEIKKDLNEWLDGFAPDDDDYEDDSSSSNASDSDASKIKPRQAKPQKEYYMANEDFEISFEGVLERYKGNGGDVVIPDGVTEIGEYVFNEYVSLTSVVIPDGVTEIGLCAFYACESLTSVTIPDSVEKIGNEAFLGCENLKSVSIPKNCEIVEGEVDRYGHSIDSFDEDCKVERRGSSSGGNSAKTSSETSDFEIENGVLKKYKGNGADVVIPDGVTEIGEDAFNSCKSLISVVIPNGVTEIGDGAFYECKSLASVTIPDSVTEICDDAFSRCTSLTSVTIPDSVTEIGEYAFCRCKSLTSVTIPDSVTEIGQYAFQDCENLKSVSIPKDCEYFEGEEDEYGEPNDSFPEGCTVKRRGSSSANATRYFVINNGVLEKYKRNGGDVVIPDGVTKIGEDAFLNCESLTSVVIPNSVTEIGKCAFDNCKSLTSVVIPDGVTEIDERVFCFCESLTSVVIPDSVTKIGELTFYTCKSLTSVVIPNSVTEIGKRAFQSCSSLASVTIPDSVTKIGEKAFSNCDSLESVSIPKYCEIIEGGVYDCYDLLDSFPEGCTVERRTSSSASTSSSGGGATTYKIQVSADEAKSGCKKILKYTRKTLCNHCEGSGCASCNGAGVKDTETKLTLNIPAGTKNGTAFSSPEGDYNKASGKKEPIVILVQVK